MEHPKITFNNITSLSTNFKSRNLFYNSTAGIDVILLTFAVDLVLLSTLNKPLYKLC